jgi:hypothetical protein
LSSTSAIQRLEVGPGFERGRHQWDVTKLVTIDRWALVLHFAAWNSRTRFAGLTPKRPDQRQNAHGAHFAILNLDTTRLDGHYVVRTRTFLSLANFKLDILTVVQCCVVITTLDFRMMDEKVFSTIFRGNKTVTFSGVEPFDCTFTHNLYFSLYWW